MWSQIPEDCNCNEQGTNSVTNPTCKDANFTSDMFIYNGDLFACAGISENDAVSIAIQKLEYYLCSVEYTKHFLTSIHNNTEIFNSFKTIVNNAVSCQTIIDLDNNCTTTTTSTSSTTTTTTTLCPPNIVENGNFNGNLSGWEQTIAGNWVYTPYGAHYVGSKMSGLLYQYILGVGITYDVTFTVTMNNPSEDVWVKVFVGSTEYGPINVVGTQTIQLTLTCQDWNMFAIQAYDNGGDPTNTIYISNVIVAEHCSSFTTTTTTSSTTTSTTSTTTTTSSSTTTTTTTSTPITTTTTTLPITYLSGNWKVFREYNPSLGQSLKVENVAILNIKQINATSVSCVNAISCNIPTYTNNIGYEADPPTSDGETQIPMYGGISTVSLSLLWRDYNIDVRYFVYVLRNNVILQTHPITNLNTYIDLSIPMSPSDNIIIKLVAF